MSESLINLVNIKDMLTSCWFTYIAVIIQRIRFYWVVKKNWGSNNSGNTWCVASGPYFSCVSWLFFLFLYFFKLIYEVDFVLMVYIWKPRSEAIKVIRTHCFLNQNTWYICIMWYSNSEKVLKIVYGIHCFHQSPVHSLFLPQEGMTSRIWHVWHCAKDKYWMPLILLLFN